MKKYIAPEMEIAKFATEDIMGPSDPIVTEGITPAADLEFKGFSDTASLTKF